MTKYGRKYGIVNEYNFVTTIQYERLFDGTERNISNSNDIFDENDIENSIQQMKDNNRKDTHGIVTYKLLIPCVSLIKNNNFKTYNNCMFFNIRGISTDSLNVDALILFVSVHIGPSYCFQFLSSKFLFPFKISC